MSRGSFRFGVPVDVRNARKNRPNLTVRNQIIDVSLRGFIKQSPWPRYKCRRFTLMDVLTVRRTCWNFSAIQPGAPAVNRADKNVENVGSRENQWDF